MAADFEEVIAEFHKESLPALFKRELKVPLDTGKAITLTGLRRSGKTYYLYQIIGELIAGGLKKQRIFYINFEDERLQGASAKDLSKIIELYYKLNPDAKTMYLFLDELQNISGWELFVRRLAERKTARIFLTGSSSKLLSKEIATSLRGRTISFSIFTLSFREFLDAKGFKPAYPLIESERGILKKHMDEFMQYGGFPELFNYDPAIKLRVLKEYIDLIIYRDLVERYGVKKLSALKFMIRSLIRNVARELSLRKLHHFFLSSNISLSKNKVYEYFSYLEDINFIFLIRKYGTGMREVEGSIPKMYLSDLGFAALESVEDNGRKMENIIAVELLRKKNYFHPLLEIFYYKDASGKEVDFVVKDITKIKQLIQACYSIDDFGTKDREIKALIDASKILKCDNLLVITWDYEGEEFFGEKKIKYVPLWKWLIEPLFA